MSKFFLSCLHERNYTLFILGSANRDFFCDIMVVHAMKNLNKGDEITLAYISPNKVYSERIQTLGNWNFTCQCRLCKLDANDGNCAERFQLFKKFDEFVKLHLSNLRKIITQGKPMLEQVN
jgi:hypothetical protein